MPPSELHEGAVLSAALYGWVAAGLVLVLRSRLPSDRSATSPRHLPQEDGLSAGAAWAALAMLAATGLHLMMLAAVAPGATLQRPAWLLAGLLLGFAGAAGSVLVGRLHRSASGHRSAAARAALHAIGMLMLAAGWAALPVLATLAAQAVGSAPWRWEGLLPVGLAACAAALLCHRAGRLPKRGAWRLGLQSTGLAVLLLMADGAAILAAAPALSLGAALPANAALTPGAMQASDAALQAAAWAVPEVLALALVPPVLLLALCQLLAMRFDALQARTSSALSEAATSHPLTHLPNRQRFEELLACAAMRADRHQQRMAVMCIDVDGLKGINESFGPAAGDALLCGLAQRLQRLVGPGDVVAHASGDEFLLLLTGNPDREVAARLATQAIERLGDVLLLEAREIATSCSIGVAMYPDDGAMSAMVTGASAALRSAKRNGRASYCFFDSRMTEGSRQQADLLQDLRRAIERRQLELFYQPKIHARGGHVTGAEALLRWRHPVRGVISPVVFVPMAEAAGLIGALGDWVIDEACRQMRAWLDDGQCFKVSINLSVHQLRQPDLVQRIGAAMARHRLPPGQLRCEITESAAMDDTGTTMSVAMQLAAAGVLLAIDDFGTGYSSLGYLRRLPVSELKIDRSFVLDLATSADACAIVDAVIRLAHALGLTVVAEGVETEAQRVKLVQLGCDELQGFLFARPMTARLLATWGPDLAPRAPRAVAGTHVA